MLVTAPLTIIIMLMQLAMTTIGNLLPTTDLTNIYETIDDFIEIVQPGLAGFHFIAGDIPFILAPIILAMYGIYYFAIIPIKLVLRIIIKGT